MKILEYPCQRKFQKRRDRHPPLSFPRSRGRPMHVPPSWASELPYISLEDVVKVDLAFPRRLSILRATLAIIALFGRFISLCSFFWQSSISHIACMTWSSLVWCYDWVREQCLIQLLLSWIGNQIMIFLHSLKNCWYTWQFAPLLNYLMVNYERIWKVSDSLGSLAM